MRADRDSGRDNREEREAIRSLVITAAGAMLQWQKRPLKRADRGTRAPYPADWIVDPRLLGQTTGGRRTKPGLPEAREAMRRLMKLDRITQHRASVLVARRMWTFWSHCRAADQTLLPRQPQLAEQLRIYYSRSRPVRVKKATIASPKAFLDFLRVKP